MRRPVVRNTVDQVSGDDRGRPYAPHLERPARRRPGRLRRQDGPHGRRRLVAGRRRAPRRRDDLRDDPREPVAHAAERRPVGAARLRPRPVPAGRRDHRRAALRDVGCRTDATRSRSSRRASLGTVVRLGHTAHAAGRRACRRSRCRCAGASCSDASRSGTARGWSARGRSSPPTRSTGPGSRAVPAGTRGVPSTTSSGSAPVIVTVTLNAAIDRTITVPNFQRGQRHRASAASRSPAARGSTSPAR